MTATHLTINGTPATDPQLANIKADLGLDQVNNTADANKPVSTAQATAIGDRLAKASNLADLPDAAVAWTNLGAGARILAQVMAGLDTTTQGTPAAGLSLLQNLGFLAARPSFTVLEASAIRSAVSAGIAAPNLYELTRPNAGRGKLAVSWQVNPLQSALTGTGFDATSVFPEAVNYPQAVTPVVYQAFGAGGAQCRAAAELADDCTATAVAFTPSLTPAAVAANTTAEQSFTVTGLTINHRIINVTKAAAQAGLQIIAFRCDAADTLKITYRNTTGGSITPTAAETYTVNTLLPSIGAQPSTFNNLAMWARAPKRADGQPYTYCRLDLGIDSSFVDCGLIGTPIRADGKWRLHILPRVAFGSQGTFQMGATRWSFARLVEQGNASTLTLSAALSVGATSATLASAFGGSTEAYPVRFSSGEVRLVSLTNGATTATWSTPLTVAATTAAVYAVVLLAQGSTDSVQVGPIYRDPSSKAFAYIRFDDGLADQYTARQTLSTPFVGQSGVTLATGAYSGKDVVNAFGLKANLFILTSCPGKPSGNFMSVAEMLDLQNTYGWAVCFQSHTNTASLNNLGLRLLGPYGYRWSQITAGGIASVDTSANTITTNAAHQMLTAGIGPAGMQGQSIEMTGTNLPAPLTTGVRYWTRPTTTTAFKLYPTELDSAQNTNAIDLTTTGTPANFGYRVWGSAPDSSAILADFNTGQALMQGWGFTAWRHHALNQGAMDYACVDAFLQLRAAGSLRTVQGTQGSTGSGNGFTPLPGVGVTCQAVGFVGGGQLGTVLSEVVTYVTNLSTEAVSEQGARDYVDALVRLGAVGGNYHHYFPTEATLRVLCAYCDQIKLRVDQGLLLTGTMMDLDGLRSQTFGT